MPALATGPSCCERLEAKLQFYKTLDTGCWETCRRCGCEIVFHKEAAERRTLVFPCAVCHRLYSLSIDESGLPLLTVLYDS